MINAADFLAAHTQCPDAAAPACAPAAEPPPTIRAADFVAAHRQAEPAPQYARAPAASGAQPAGARPASIQRNTR